MGNHDDHADRRKSHRRDHGDRDRSRSRGRKHRDSSRDGGREREKGRDWDRGHHGGGRPRGTNEKDGQRERDGGRDRDLDNGKNRDRHRDRDRDRDRDSKNKLTEEEEMLYAKARAFLEREEGADKRKDEKRSHRDDKVGKSDHGSHDSGKSRRGEKDHEREEHRYDGDDNDSGDDERKRKHDGGDHKHNHSKKYSSNRHKHESISSSRHELKKSDRRKDRKRSRSKEMYRDRSDDESDGVDTRDKKHDRHRRKKRKTKHSHRDKRSQKHNDSETINGEDDSDSPSKKHPSSFRSKAKKLDSKTKDLLIPLGNIRKSTANSTKQTPPTPLDPETSYFSHNPHLRIYLYRTYGIYFEDLTSDEAREAFVEFTAKYNAGELEEAYYSPGGLPQEALDQCQRTQHRWKFRTNKVEERSLEVVRAGVRKQTEYDAGGGGGGAVGHSRMPPVAAESKSPVDANVTVTHQQPVKEHDKRPWGRSHHAKNELLDPSLTSKPDSGWERQLEKRKQRSEATHGSARDREAEAYGGAELDDDAIYGSGGVIGGGRGNRRNELSYDEALARERRFKEKKEAEKAARVEELRMKEEEKQKKMLDMLGLSGIATTGKKITIAPRNDNSGGTS
ncbi:hypothetical protein ACHAXS_005985 [Conticribra weissflogii]